MRKLFRHGDILVVEVVQNNITFVRVRKLFGKIDRSFSLRNGIQNTSYKLPDSLRVTGAIATAFANVIADINGLIATPDPKSWSDVIGHWQFNLRAIKQTDLT